MPAVTLLSTPAIISEGQTFTPPKGKTSALLYYLAYQNDWVSREDILYLFWPDTEEHKARANLRQLLRSLKNLPYLEQLEITANQLYWPVKTDVQAFKKHFSQKDFSNTIAVYQGALLEGLRISSFPEYESWLEYERSSLFASFKEAVYVLAHKYEEAKRFKDAAELLEKLYKLEPFDETCLKAFLSYLKLDAQFEKLEIIYQQFEKQLWQELDAKPSAEIQAFFETVRTNEGIKEQTKKNLVDFSNPMVNLPTYSTPFIGRSEELASLAAQILDESCRLITLMAAGGMGKTRLATELAKTLVEHFSDGVCFVPFEAVETPAQMLNVVIEALEIKLSDGSPMASLVNFLESKTFLLIFDNLEHLTAYTNLITEILSKTPNIKIVATSRERLNLHSEWIYDLEGLKLSTETNQTSDAQMLFTKSAKKARSSFKVNDDNKKAISKICERLGGMPLALELAASWLRIISVKEVLEELEQGLELLNTSVSDLPERHLDVASVFESSWLRLTAAEQLALTNLAVFEGGFSREAAQAVANVGLPLLLLLINKSFLKQTSSRRFLPHPLMWQFIRSKAQLNPAAYELTKEQHSHYYLNFIKERESFFEQVNVQDIRNEFNIELANIRQAWAFATEKKQEDLLALADLTLFFFFLYEGRYKEGAEFFKQSSQVLTSENLIHARILHRYGALLNVSGDQETSRPLLEHSLALKRHHKSSWDIAHALLSLGINYIFSEYISAKEQVVLWQECAELFGQVGDQALQGRALAHQAEFITNANKREQVLQESLALLRKQKGYHELSSCVSTLAKHFAYSYGDYAKADQLINEPIALEQSKGNLSNLSIRLASKTEFLLLSGDYKRVKECLESLLSLDITYKPHRFYALQTLTYLQVLEGNMQTPNLDSKEANNIRNISDNYLISLPAYYVTKNLLALKKPIEALNWSKKAIIAVSKVKNLKMETAWFKTMCFLQSTHVLFINEAYEPSKQALSIAIHLALEWQFRPALLEAILHFALLYKAQSEDADLLNAFVLQNKASMFESKESARKHLDRLPKDLKERVVEQSKQLTLERLVEDLLLEE